MSFDPLKLPDLSKDFPSSVPDLKIKPDLGNPSHGGPHFDIMTGIGGPGTEQTRVTPGGDILGGTTNIGPNKLDWKP